MPNGAGPIFLFPFAGASRGCYAPLLPPAGSPERRRFLPIGLPGRGERMREPSPRDLEALAADAFRQIAPDLTSDAIFFGHSMGALLALLVARSARNSGLALPRALIVSGMSGPSRSSGRKRHLLPHDELRRELRRLGGSPDEILDDEELFAFFEPTVRGDLTAVETHSYRPEPPLPVPLTVILGTEDDVTAEGGDAWQIETTHPLRRADFPGGHFFIFDHADALRRLITAA